MKIFRITIILMIVILTLSNATQAAAKCDYSYGSEMAIITENTSLKTDKKIARPIDTFCSDLQVITKDPIKLTNQNIILWYDNKVNRYVPIMIFGETTDGWLYELTKIALDGTGEVEIIGNTKIPTPYVHTIPEYDLTIPSQICIKEGYTFNVTSIGEKAFYHIDNLRVIKIPDSITYIGRYAFYTSDEPLLRQCALTHYVIYGNPVIGYNAFNIWGNDWYAYRPYHVKKNAYNVLSFLDYNDFMYDYLDE